MYIMIPITIKIAIAIKTFFTLIFFKKFVVDPVDFILLFLVALTLFNDEFETAFKDVLLAGLLELFLNKLGILNKDLLLLELVVLFIYSYNYKIFLFKIK